MRKRRLYAAKFFDPLFYLEIEISGKLGGVDTDMNDEFIYIAVAVT